MPQCQDTGIFFEIESAQYHKALRMHEEALDVVGYGFKHNFVVNLYRDNGSALPVAVPLKVASTTLKETLQHQATHAGQKATWLKSGKNNKHSHALNYCLLCTSPPDAQPMTLAHIKRDLTPLFFRF